MVDIVVLTKMRPDSFKNLRTFTDHLVLYKDVSAESIDT